MSVNLRAVIKLVIRLLIFFFLFLLTFSLNERLIISLTHPTTVKKTKSQVLVNASSWAIPWVLGQVRLNYCNEQKATLRQNPDRYYSIPLNTMLDYEIVRFMLNPVNY